MKRMNANLVITLCLAIDYVEMLENGASQSIEKTINRGRKHETII